MSEERKSIKAGKLVNKNPDKRLLLTIKEQSVKTEHIADGAITSQKVSSDAIEYITADVQNQIDSIQIGGWAISNQLGNDPHIGISQKTLTELIGYDNVPDSIRGRIQKVEDEIGTDTTSDSLSGRITSLEEAVGTGGTIDARIEQTKEDILGNVSSDYDTLKKCEDKIKEEAAFRTNAVNTEATARNNAVLNEAEARTNAITLETSRALTAESTLDNKISSSVNEAKEEAHEELLAEIDRAMAAEEELRQTYEALTQSDIVIGTLPASGVETKIYRVPGTNSYSDYMWNGSQFVKMAEYDNATDDEPTTSSTNLVKSGGVASYYGDYSENPEFLNVVTDSDNKVLYGVEKNGNFFFGAGLPSQVQDELETLDRNLRKEIENVKKEWEDTEKTSIFAFNPAHEYNPAVQALKAAHYNSVAGTTSKAPTTLLWFTDIHGSADAYKRINDWSDYYTNSIDDVIATGDLVEVHFFEDFSWWNNSKILQVLGNHDSWASESDFDQSQYPGLNYEDMVYGKYSATRDIIKQKYVYDKFIAPNVSNWNVIQPALADTYGLCFFYKDYGNIRMIALDGNHYDRGDYLIDGVDVQAQWLRSVLSDALLAGKSCVISCHYQPWSLELIDCSFNRDRGRHTLNPTPNMTDAASAVSDFIGSGGDFICWISGHRHYDFIGMCSATENPFLVISLTCSSWSKNAINAAHLNMRKANTKTQDAFAMISFDAERGLIKMLRVGADTNENMEKSRNIVFRYKDVVDEYGNTLEKGLVLCN